MRKILIGALLFICMFFYTDVFSVVQTFEPSIKPEITRLKDAPLPIIKKIQRSERILAKKPYGHFTNFDTEDGLALSNITCVYVDRIGRVWFGTHGGGVSIFDGKSFKTFTTKHGLIHNSVWAITEDSEGNFWFGTFGGGITKYDGVSFKSYTTDDGLANNTIWSIFGDDDGSVWIGTFGGGVSKFDGKSFSTINTDDGLINNIVWDVTKDSKGNFWFATEGGVSKFDGKDFFNITTKDGLIHNVVRCIVEDRLGNFWFGTFGGGASYYDGKTFTNYNERNGLSNNVIRELMEDSYGNIWFATHGGGASMFNGRDFFNFSKEQGLAHDILRGVAEDKQGNIWFATDGGGVSKYNGKAVNIYTKKQGLAYNAVRHIAEDDKGQLWFGTNGGGLSVFDGMYFSNYTIDSGMATNTIYHIYPLRNGNVWMGTPEGLTLFDGKSFTFYNSSHGLAHDRVLGILQDSEDNMWFGTSGGLSKFDGNAFTTYRTEHGLVHPVVRSIAQDSLGHIWVSTYGGGVSRFDGNKFHSYTVDDGLGHNWVRKILIDSNGYIWFGTYGGGINRYDGKTFISYTTEDGLADDVVYDMVEDEDGIIWIGTNLGISGLFFKKINENAKYTPGLLNIDNENLVREYTPVWEIYNNQTGFPIKDINSNAMCLAEKGLPKGNLKDKGLIWGACGDDKIICFDPKAVRRNLSPPALVINNVLIDAENVCWYSLKAMQQKNRKGSDDLFIDSLVLTQQQLLRYGRALSGELNGAFLKKFADIKFDDITKFNNLPVNLRLPYHHNHISFEFIAIETGRHLLINYQYMLEGQDKTWRPLTKNNFASYSNLWEGKYTFKLRSQSPEGIWSDYVSFSFRVLPPWYRTWWMYVVYFIAIFSILWLYLKWRLGSLKREKEYLSKKIEERTAQLLCQKEEAERQKALVEEKNVEILEQKEEILQQKEELQVQSIELEKINSNLEDRIAEELAESRKKDFLLIQQSRQAAMGEMIANIAHQWRQPLNAVGLIIQNLQEAFDYNEMTKEYLDSKVKQSMDIIMYMSETINDFRDFFRPDRVAGEFDVKKIVMRSISFVEDTMKKCNISLEYSLEDGVLSYGYPNEYAQVVLNLINNARDVLTEREVDNPKIEITLTKLNDKSLLTVSDNGGGIKKGVEDRIFDPYFSTKKKGDGTGLGLYMSKTIIEKIEGSSLTFENTDVGAKFIVIL
jgi:ligand-binding sensor domain-containing protein